MRKTIVIDGKIYEEESNLDKLLGIIGGFCVALFPICLFIGCILPIFLP